MAEVIPTIIAVAQTPPPLHGQAVMNQFLLESEYTKFRFHHVRMAFSNDIQEVGAFRWKKILHLIQVFFQIVIARFVTGSQILYYPPASPNMTPFLRDCALLIGTRWLFKKTIFHFHSNGLADLYPNLPWALKPFFRLAYDKPALSIVISNHGQKDAEFIRSCKMTIIPNGIPDQNMALKLDRMPEKSIPNILFCGMVIEEKGIGVLLRACLLLKERGLQFDCKIVGRARSEAEQNIFLQFIEFHKLGYRVELSGPLYDMDKWKTYADADIFCFPTFYSAESFGLVAVEAMMFRLPVVATNWRGLPDIVSEGESGYLVPPMDTNTLAERLEHLIRNPQLRSAMGAAGRRRYEEKYTIDRFRASVEAVLYSVCCS